MSDQKRALALGSGITLLGVVRALSDVGADVLALPDADRVTRRSRFYRSAPPELTGAQSATIAEAVSCLPRRTVLFPCSDSWARAVAALPIEVRDNYPASVPPLDAIDVLVDKASFRSALEKLGLAHPMTRELSGISDLDSIPEDVLSSSFLKPAHSQQFFARFGVKAFRVSSREDARRRLASCLDAGVEMLLQEYIPGPPTNHYFIDGFVDRNGEVRALFARRRLRMNPPDFGNSTLMVSVALSEVAPAIAVMRELLRHLRYRGIFSAEFKRDERTGVFNLIEVNARPWWYVEFAARCGVNVCALALDDALGEPVQTITQYEVGRRCVFPYYDFEAVRAEFAEGKLGGLDWARSWIGAYQPVFRWSDPWPALSESATLLFQRFRRRN